GGFATAGHFVALVDGQGAVAAASPGFDQLGIATTVLQDLVADVAGDRDRLVKRLVPGTRSFPAGMARLTDTLHLLVVVDEPQPGAEPLDPQAADAGQAAPEPATPEPATDEPAGSPPPSRDADLAHEGWYFGRSGEPEEPGDGRA